MREEIPSDLTVTLFSTGEFVPILDAAVFEAVPWPDCCCCCCCCCLATAADIVVLI